MNKKNIKTAKKRKRSKDLVRCLNKAKKVIEASININKHFGGFISNTK